VNVKKKHSTLWTIVVGLLIASGLAIVGFFVLLAIALQSYGSNK
jgi:hypothetical protein